MTKPLSQLLEEIEVESADRMSLRNDLAKLKRVAIELAKGLESQAVPFHEHDIIWDCKDVADEYLNSAKDIIGGGDKHDNNKT